LALVSIDNIEIKMEEAIKCTQMLKELEGVMVSILLQEVEVKSVPRFEGIKETLHGKAIHAIETRAVEVDKVLEKGGILSPFICKEYEMLKEFNNLFHTLHPITLNLSFKDSFIKNRYTLFELLLFIGVNPSIDTNYAIRFTANCGNIAFVERLLQDPRVDPSANNNEALRAASRNGYLAIIERLLQDPRVDPSDKDNDAIRVASFKGHFTIVERLLQDPRVDPSDEDNDAITSASHNGHIAVVECLLRDKRVDPSTNDNYAINYATRNGHLAIVKRLLQDPRVGPYADIKQTIAFALKQKYDDIVELLLLDSRFLVAYYAT
jgi:hypothetical protein